MRLATWNVNSLKVRLGRVEEWLAYAQPDVVCLQETKLSDATFPHMAFSALGYESVHHGFGQWNGVAILSRVGIEDPVYGFAETLEADTDSRLITATCGGARILSVYVPNGRAVDDPHYQYKLAWLDRLRHHLDLVADPNQPVAVCGDFNVAPDDRDVWDPAAFVGSTHVSKPERDALVHLEGWGLQDAFRLEYDQDRLYSYWDYRAGDFHQHRGMRIDLMLVSKPLAERLSWAIIDRNARKGKLPSDHAPVVIDVVDEDARVSDSPEPSAAEAMAERLRRAQGATPGPRRAEARRLGDAMRLVIDRLATTSASLDHLAAAADQLEAIAAAMEDFPKRRLYDGFAESANSGDAHAFFDWSPLLGRSNALAPPIIVEGVDGRVIGRVRFGSAYEGPPGCVHGGFIAAGFDEVLGLTNSMSGAPAMTANLTVRYRQPTPLHRELKYVGVLVDVSGRKVKTRGELWAGDTMTAEAQGLFVRVGMAKFVELMEARQRGEGA